MKVFHYYDGDVLDQGQYTRLLNKGLIHSRDVTYSQNNANARLNTVGFSINTRDEVLLVFPKHYRVDKSNPLASFRAVFRSLQRASEIATTSSGGPSLPQSDEHGFSCNYPFRAYFQIYRHFTTHGLHFKQIQTLNTNSGKVNWKATIARSNYYLVQKCIQIFPIQRHHRINATHIITDAMIYAINHTADTFGTLLGIRRISAECSFTIHPQSYDWLIFQLRSYRNIVFDDRTVDLIDRLIEFYSSLNHGCGYHFKCSNFAYVWELAVASYLSQHFSHFECSTAVFDERCTSQLSFSKLPISHTNAANPLQRIEIDHYAYDSTRETQYLFDAKYYGAITGLDYKQIYYTLTMLLDPKRLDCTTYSALILPSLTPGTVTHFVFDDRFGRHLPKHWRNLEIYEIYLDCASVINSFSMSSLDC